MEVESYDWSLNTLSTNKMRMGMMMMMVVTTVTTTLMIIMMMLIIYFTLVFKIEYRINRLVVLLYYHPQALSNQSILLYLKLNTMQLVTPGVNHCCLMANDVQN